MEMPEPPREPAHLVGVVKICPHCSSPDTKWRYYNNKKKTQPRYFCNGCSRYFTHGGKARMPKEKNQVARVNAEEAARKDQAADRRVALRAAKREGACDQVGAQLALPRKRTRSTSIGSGDDDLHAQIPPPTPGITKIGKTASGSARTRLRLPGGLVLKLYPTPAGQTEMVGAPGRASQPGDESDDVAIHDSELEIALSMLASEHSEGDVDPLLTADLALEMDCLDPSECSVEEMDWLDCPECTMEEMNWLRGLPGYSEEMNSLGFPESTVGRGRCQNLILEFNCGGLRNSSEPGLESLNPWEVECVNFIISWNPLVLVDSGSQCTH